MQTERRNPRMSGSMRRHMGLTPQADAPSSISWRAHRISAQASSVLSRGAPDRWPPVGRWPRDPLSSSLKRRNPPMQRILERVRAGFASGPRGRSVWRSAGLAGALSMVAIAMLLASCGKSTQTVGPDPQVGAGANAKVGDGATSFAGTPSAKFAYSSSDIALIKQTSSTSGWVTVLSCQLKTPAAKEMYVSGSLETGLFTQTLVRSKNNKKDTSTASVGIQVQALIDGKQMEPGTVTYAARTQTLSATLEGAIGGCLSIVNNADGTQTIVVDQNCVTPEGINLILSTLNASSFGFVSTDVPVGTH